MNAREKTFDLQRAAEWHGFRLSFDDAQTLHRARRGALRRVADVCERLGLHFYHQGDPRGCSLYVDNEPIPDNNYTRAIACIR